MCVCVCVFSLMCVCVCSSEILCKSLGEDRNSSKGSLSCRGAEGAKVIGGGGWGTKPPNVVRGLGGLGNESPHKLQHTSILKQI